MGLQTFDDGSTYDSDTGQATQSPPGALLSDYASNFSPSNLSPGATNMADVLKYGFGRIIDYKTASLAAQNATPQYSQTKSSLVAQPRQLDTMTLLLIGGAVLACVLLSSKG